MHELADRLQLVIAGDLLLDEVLDRLDVVIGGALDVLDALGVLDIEMVYDPVQNMVGMLAECRDFSDCRVRRELLQPAHFHLHPMADKAVFAENGAQVCRFAAVAAVNGGNRSQFGEFHAGSTQGHVKPAIIHEMGRKLSRNEPVAGVHPGRPTETKPSRRGDAPTGTQTYPAGRRRPRSDQGNEIIAPGRRSYGNGDVSRR